MPPPTTTTATTAAPKPSAPAKKNLRLFKEAMYGGVSGSSQETSMHYNAICLGLIITVLLIISIVLIVLAATMDIPDLYLLGGILFVGCFVFCFLLFTTVCRPLCRRNQVYDSRPFEKKFDITQEVGTVITQKQIISSVPPQAVPAPYSYESESYYIDSTPPVSASQPDRTNLYRDGSRSDFIATPATTKDVRFYSGEDTPPPPRVKMVGQGGKSKSLYSMDIPPLVFTGEQREDSAVQELELL